MNRSQTNSVSLAIAVTVLALGAAASAYSQGNPVRLMKGMIACSNGRSPVRGGTILAFTGTSNEPAVIAKINKSTGSYQIVLNAATTYRLTIKSSGFHDAQYTLSTSNGAGYEESVKDFSIEAVQKGETIYSGSLFSVGGTQPVPSDEWRTILQFLKEQRGLAITILVAPDATAGKGSGSKGGKKRGASTTDAAVVGDRVTALKKLFEQSNIEPERITWVALDQHSAVAKLKDSFSRSRANVAIQVNNISAASDKSTPARVDDDE